MSDNIKDDKKAFSVLAILSSLKDLGVSEIRIQYDGGGDEGSITETDFLDANEDYVDIERDSFVDPIQDWGYKLLSKECGDWVNGDGGYGTITIQVPSGEYVVDGQLRTTMDDGGSGELKDHYQEDEEDD